MFHLVNLLSGEDGDGRQLRGPQGCCDDLFGEQLMTLKPFRSDVELKGSENVLGE